MSEADFVRERYAKRAQPAVASRYNPLNPSVYMAVHEKERALIRWIRDCRIAPLQDKRVLEIGCGSGPNLLQLLSLGFLPENLVGNELLPERAREARNRLPMATRLVIGDAAELPLDNQQFDIVYQSMVFTSILDNAFQQTMADSMWSLTRSGGGILWYDFTFNNPKNPDVRGVSMSRIKALFPRGKVTSWRVTLAPPVSRAVTRLHPSLYSLFNILPCLRTHVLAWIEK